MTGSHRPNRKAFKSPKNHFCDYFTLAIIELEPVTLKKSLETNGFSSVGIRKMKFIELVHQLDMKLTMHALCGID